MSSFVQTFFAGVSGAGAGEEFAGLVSSNVAVGAEKVKETLKSFEAIGATDVIFNPGVGDLDEISRLADAVL